MRCVVRRSALLTATHVAHICTLFQSLHFVISLMCSEKRWWFRLGTLQSSALYKQFVPLQVASLFPLLLFNAARTNSVRKMVAFVSALPVARGGLTCANVCTELSTSTFTRDVVSRSTRARIMQRKSSPTMIATGQPLEDWLSMVEKELGSCTRAIFAACKEIAYKIRTASCDKMSCFNDFGDEQLAIDVLADKLIFDNLMASGVVATASSEEVPVEKPMSPDGKFSVAFDPLDGSSIIDTNFSVGTYVTGR